MHIEFNDQYKGQNINSYNNLKTAINQIDKLLSILEEGQVLYLGKKTFAIANNEHTLNLKIADKTTMKEKIDKITLDKRFITLQKALEIHAFIQEMSTNKAQQELEDQFEEDKELDGKELNDLHSNKQNSNLAKSNEVETHDHSSPTGESQKSHELNPAPHSTPANLASPNVIIKADAKWQNMLAQHQFTQIQIKHTNGQTQVFDANIKIQTLTAQESAELQQRVHTLIEMAQAYQKQNQEKHKTDETKITFSARELPRVDNVVMQKTADSDNTPLDDLLKKNKNILNNLIIKTMEQAEEDQRKLEAEAKRKKDLQDLIVKEDIEHSEIKSQSIKSDIVANLISNSNIQKWLAA